MSLEPMALIWCSGLLAAVLISRRLRVSRMNVMLMMMRTNFNTHAYGSTAIRRGVVESFSEVARRRYSGIGEEVEGIKCVLIQFD